MTTLPKSITRQFFREENGYHQLTQLWSWLINSPAREQLEAGHHLAYAILRGKDWRKGFRATATGDGIITEGGVRAIDGLGWALHLFHGLFPAREDGYVDTRVIHRRINDLLDGTGAEAYERPQL